jgi:hypothetical protein
MLAISFKFSSRFFAHGDENFSFKGGNPNVGSENFFGILISPLLRDDGFGEIPRAAVSGAAQWKYILQS